VLKSQPLHYDRLAITELHKQYSQNNDRCVCSYTMLLIPITRPHHVGFQTAYIACSKGIWYCKAVGLQKKLATKD